MSKMNSVQANSDCQRTILQYSFEFDAVYYYSENRSLTEFLDSKETNSFDNNYQSYFLIIEKGKLSFYN